MNIKQLFILITLIASALCCPTDRLTLPAQAATATFDCTAVSEIPQAECEALVALYNETDGPNWDDTTGWLVTDTPCGWYGVSCRDGFVTRISLHNNNLVGKIPSEIGNFSNLTTLIFTNNQLSLIADEIGNLSNLSLLYLNYNQLNTLPTGIGNLANLTLLWVYNNQLNTLPSQIGDLSNLDELFLHNNQLSTLPSEIGNLSNLRNLTLQNNRLSEIPTEIGELSNLTQLFLYTNYLNTLPLSITSLSNLTRFEIDYNRLQISDANVYGFLTENDSTWANNQTVVPDNISVVSQSDTSLGLEWMPINYLADGGYYEISCSTDISGPYIIHGITENKLASEYELTNLNANTTYYLRIRTYTAANSSIQDNEIWSDYSNIISATTLNAPTPTVTRTPTPTNTDTATPTHTATATSTNTPTNTSTVTSTPTHTATNTDTPTNTPTSTYTPTDTPTQTPTFTNTATPTNSAIPSPTWTGTPNPTPIPTDTQTVTPTPVPTTAPPTATPILTDTPVPPTHTSTTTATNPPPQSTLPSGTLIATHTMTATSTDTATSTATVTSTDTPLPTYTSTATTTNTPVPPALPPTNTPLPTYTSTATSTDTVIPTATVPPSPTHTPPPSATATEIVTWTSEPTYTPRPTYTDFPTHTPLPTATSTDTPTPTPIHTATHTPTVTSTVTPTPIPPTVGPTEAGPEEPTATQMPSATATWTATWTATATATPTATATATATATPTYTPTPVCYQLNLAVSVGAGNPPMAVPERSVGCPQGQYQAGEPIELEAKPARGWTVQGWRGTADNAAKTHFNRLRMPAGSHDVLAIYTQLSAFRSIQRLQTDCRGLTPEGETEQVHCIAGLVYHHGVEWAGVPVEITNQQGESAEVKTDVRLSNPERRPYYHFDLHQLGIEPGQPYTLSATYDGIEKTLTRLVAGEGYQQVDIVLPSPVTAYPIATINDLAGTHFVEGEILAAQGTGQDQQGADDVQAYRWLSDLDGVIGESSGLAKPVNELTPGRHRLTFQVQDSLGQWSPRTVVDEIEIEREPKAGWVMLLYLAGDYHDEDKLWNTFQTVRRSLPDVNKPQLRIVAQIDGYDRMTQRWAFEPGQAPREIALQDELAMDDGETLREFLIWGQSEYPANHYYLVIADHGQGARGIAWDSTSDQADDDQLNYSAYLTVKELGAALNDPRVAPVDVLHLDACSMSLVEIAYEVGNRTQVLVASQYLSWDYFAYDRYAKGIQGGTTPRGLGRQIVQTYTKMTEEGQYPYTISALDTQRIGTVMQALEQFVLALDTRVRSGEIDRSRLLEIRDEVQNFDSQGNFINEVDDLYIDLRHWADRIGVALPAVRSEAEALAEELEKFVLANSVRSGNIGDAVVTLDHAYGVSIFYPRSRNHETYRSYVNDGEFTFVADASWRPFLRAVLGPAILEPGITLTPEAKPLPPGNPFATPTYTPSVTPTLSPTLSPTPAPTATPTPTETVTATFTQTPTVVPTSTATPSPTVPSTATATIPPTNTPTPTATSTVIPGDTPTATPTPPCDTDRDELCGEGFEYPNRLYLPIVER